MTTENPSIRGGGGLLKRGTEKGTNLNREFCIGSYIVCTCTCMCVNVLLSKISKNYINYILTARKII